MSRKSSCDWIKKAKEVEKEGVEEEEITDQLGMEVHQGRNSYHMSKVDYHRKRCTVCPKNLGQLEHHFITCFSKSLGLIFHCHNVLITQ